MTKVKEIAHAVLEAGEEKNRVHKVLEDANIKLASFGGIEELSNA
jgi:hypothetical protein